MQLCSFNYLTKIVLAPLSSLNFHINLKINLLISLKMSTKIPAGIALNLQISLRELTWISTILSLLKYEHVMYIHSFKSPLTMLCSFHHTCTFFIKDTEFILKYFMLFDAIVNVIFIILYNFFTVNIKKFYLYIFILYPAILLKSLILLVLNNSLWFPT